MNSLESRLRLGLSAVMIALIGVIGVAGNQALLTMTEGFVASRLQHDAEGLLAAMMIDPSRAKVRWRRINQVYSQPFSGHYYLVQFSDGKTLRSRSLWDYSLKVPQLAQGESRRELVPGPSGQQLLLLLNGYRKSGRDFTLAVAEDLTPMFHERNEFSRWFVLLALGGLIVMLLVQSLMVRRSFGPMKRIQEDMHRLEQGQVTELSEDVPSEVLPLVEEFNRLLRLLNQRLVRSRNALGNLAHAIKGPLHLLTQYFDTSGVNTDKSEQKQAALQADRIRELMERELKRARLAGKAPSSRRFDPAEELPDLISVLQQVHRDNVIKVELKIDKNVNSFGDREDMLELMGNLLDNACKWATSRVICRIERGESIKIVVEDDGAGLKDNKINHLTERGTRLDENVEGHGLGLAIVGDIVNIYDGSITFLRSEELGGLCVQVLMPSILNIPNT
jgi:signal transduction histidine kinase